MRIGYGQASKFGKNFDTPVVGPQFRKQSVSRFPETVAAPDNNESYKKIIMGSAQRNLISNKGLKADIRWNKSGAYGTRATGTQDANPPTSQLITEANEMDSHKEAAAYYQRKAAKHLMVIRELQKQAPPLDIIGPMSDKPDNVLEKDAEEKYYEGMIPKTPEERAKEEKERMAAAEKKNVEKNRKALGLPPLPPEESDKKRKRSDEEPPAAPPSHAENADPSESTTMPPRTSTRTRSGATSSLSSRNTTIRPERFRNPQTTRIPGVRYGYLDKPSEDLKSQAEEAAREENTSEILGFSGGTKQQGDYRKTGEHSNHALREHLPGASTANASGVGSDQFMDFGATSIKTTPPPGTRSSREDPPPPESKKEDAEKRGKEAAEGGVGGTILSAAAKKGKDVAQKKLEGAAKRKADEILTKQAEEQTQKSVYEESAGKTLRQRGAKRLAQEEGGSLVEGAGEGVVEETAGEILAEGAGEIAAEEGVVAGGEALLGETLIAEGFATGGPLNPVSTAAIILGVALTAYELNKYRKLKKKGKSDKEAVDTIVKERELERGDRSIPGEEDYDMMPEVPPTGEDDDTFERIHVGEKRSGKKKSFWKTRKQKNGKTVKGKSGTIYSYDDKKKKYKRLPARSAKSKMAKYGGGNGSLSPGKGERFYVKMKKSKK